MRVRQCGVHFLFVSAFLASILVQPASTHYFDNYVKWANTAFNGGPSGTPGANCTYAAVDFLDFVYAVVKGVAPTVGTAKLTRTCSTCSAALDAALGLMPNSDPGVCQLLPYATTANLTAVALRRFVCFGTDAASGGAGGNSSGAAGSCVVQLTDMLQSVGLINRVRTLDPTLRFSGPLLSGLCAALWPPPATSAISCCARSWAYLMAALTQQACLPALSQEYASLPGRCEALLNRTVPGYCEASWPIDLLPLLAPPPLAVCGPSPSASSLAPFWLNCSQCSPQQLLMTQPAAAAGTPCDLWCGLCGEMQRVASGEIPGPQNSDNNSTTSGTPPTSHGGSGARRSRLHTATIVIACVFSVLIAALLITLAIFAYSVYNEKRTLKKEQYQFDLDLHNACPSAPGSPRGPHGKPLAPPPPPVLPPPPPLKAPPTDSNQPSPLAPRSVSIPPEAAASPGSVVRTPRYSPGPPPPPPQVKAVAATEAGPGQPAGLTNGSHAARVLVFGGPTAAVAGRGGGGGGRPTTTDTASHSSRYESAVSQSDKSPVGAGPVPYSTSPGSDPKLVRMVSAASAPALAASAAGSPITAMAEADRLKSHRLSLTGSETGPSTYHTAFESHSAAAGALDPSGSYATARSTYTAGGSGAAASAGAGSATPIPGSGPNSRQQSATAVAAPGTPPPR